MSTWPKAWSWGYIWPKVSLPWRSDKNVNLTHSLILRGYVWPKVSLTQILPKCQSDPKPDHEWYVWPNVSLTRNLPKHQPDPKSAQMSTWLKVCLNVNLTQSPISGRCLTNGHPDPKSAQMSTWPKTWSFGYIWSRSAWPKDLTKMSTLSEALTMGGPLD